MLTSIAAPPASHSAHLVSFNNRRATDTLLHAVRRLGRHENSHRGQSPTAGGGSQICLGKQPSAAIEDAQSAKGEHQIGIRRWSVPASASGRAGRSNTQTQRMAVSPYSMMRPGLLAVPPLQLRKCFVRGLLARHDHGQRP